MKFRDLGGKIIKGVNKAKVTTTGTTVVQDQSYTDTDIIYDSDRLTYSSKNNIYEDTYIREYSKREINSEKPKWGKFITKS